MSLISRWKGTSTRPKVVTVLVVVAVVAVVVVAIIAGHARQVKAEAREGYEQVVATYEDERAKLDAAYAHGNEILPECASLTKKIVGPCENLKVALSQPVRNLELPEFDPVGASTEELKAARADVEAQLEKVRSAQALLDKAIANAEGEIEQAHTEFREKTLASRVTEAQAAIKAAREEVENAQGKVLDESLISNVLDKADALEQFIDDLQGRMDDMTYDEAVDTASSLTASTNELAAEKTKLSVAVAANQVGGLGTFEGVTPKDENTSARGASTGGTASSGGTAPRASQPAQGGNNPAPAPQPAPKPAPAPAPAPKPAAPTLSRADTVCTGGTDGAPFKCRVECYDESGAPYYGPLYGLTTEAGVPITQCWGPYV